MPGMLDEARLYLLGGRDVVVYDVNDLPITAGRLGINPDNPKGYLVGGLFPFDLSEVRKVELGNAIIKLHRPTNMP